MELLTFVVVAVFTGASFLVMPFAGGLFFSMAVDPAWRRGAQAARTRQVYVSGVVLTALLAAVALPLLRLQPLASSAVAIVQVLACVLLWRWAWGKTLPHRVDHPVVRGITLGSAVQSRASSVLTWASLAVPAAAAMVLAAHYAQLPQRIAYHYGSAGVPDETGTRSPLLVFGPLLIAVLTVALLVFCGAAIRRRGAGVADRGRYLALTGWVLTATAWFASLVLSAGAMLPLLQATPAMPALVSKAVGTGLVLFLLVVFGLVIFSRSCVATAQRTTDAAHWRGGLYYFNRDDAAWFVPKRLGFGWTLNLARPGAWAILIGILAVALVPSLLRHLH